MCSTTGTRGGLIKGNTSSAVNTANCAREIDTAAPTSSLHTGKTLILLSRSVPKRSTMSTLIILSALLTPPSALS